MVAEPRGPIPVTLLTGFLGSGKTTLLAALLRGLGHGAAGVGGAEDPARSGPLGVLLDEVDGTALDHPLLGALPPGALDLVAGCLCCAARDALAESVARLAARGPARIVLETAGVADPAPVLDAFARGGRLAGLARVDGVVAVLDVPRGAELLDAHAEARRQVELADRIVLTQAERAPSRLGPLRERLAGLAPGAEVREAGPGGTGVDPAWLLAGPALARVADGAVARAWLHAGGTPAGWRTRLVHVPRAADPSLVALWLRLVTQFDAPRLLRAKLLVEDRADGSVWVLQSVGGWVAPPRRLEAPPAGHVGVRCALVTRDLPEDVLERVAASLRQAVAARPPA